jgi:hypothetical protein
VQVDKGRSDSEICLKGIIFIDIEFEQNIGSWEFWPDPIFKI